jgi:hypothetical protein
MHLVGQASQSESFIQLLEFVQEFMDQVLLPVYNYLPSTGIQKGSSWGYPPVI